MPLDTAKKRRSAVAISFYPLGPGILPDGGIGNQDRRVVGYGYHGFASARIIVKLLGVISGTVILAGDVFSIAGFSGEIEAEISLTGEINITQGLSGRIQSIVEKSEEV